MIIQVCGVKNRRPEDGHLKHRVYRKCRGVLIAKNSEQGWSESEGRSQRVLSGRSQGSQLRGELDCLLVGHCEGC